MEIKFNKEKKWIEAKIIYIKSRQGTIYKIFEKDNNLRLEFLNPKAKVKYGRAK